MAEETEQVVDAAGPQQYEQLLDVAEGRISKPSLPTDTTITQAVQEVKPEELETDIAMPSTTLGPLQEVSAEGLDISAPSLQQAATYQAYVSPNTPEFTAAQGQVSVGRTVQFSTGGQAPSRMGGTCS